ncbi:hypothetical protein SKAU_G00339160 [Synaphobranchus kaupii]|uniref:Uncharacterized protein n=1 Tax=Synaphobranchus kaupii TaxID=118154 RepID=A0A9Q1IIC2_SYNKA|nr:hypothetical protein SKAU_G00339160 [Synaphobranchus kaupii]
MASLRNLQEVSHKAVLPGRLHSISRLLRRRFTASCRWQAVDSSQENSFLRASQKLWRLGRFGGRNGAWSSRRSDSLKSGGLLSFWVSGQGMWLCCVAVVVSEERVVFDAVVACALTRRRHPEWRRTEACVCGVREGVGGEPPMAEGTWQVQASRQERADWFSVYD